MVKFKEFLLAMHQAKAEIIIVGGLAATLHGSSQITNDLDICYQRTKKNYQALVQGLTPFKPQLRGPKREKIPFLFDEKTLQQGLNFTLITSHGDIDLLGELQGLGGYDQLLPATKTMTLYGLSFKVIGLEDLIRAKKALRRTKDLLHLDELEALQALTKK